MSKGRVTFGNPDTNLCLIKVNGQEQRMTKSEFIDKLNELRHSNQVNEIYMTRKKDKSNFKVIFYDGDEMKINSVSKEDEHYSDLKKMSTVNVSLVAKTGAIAALAASGIIFISSPAGKEVVSDVQSYVETTIENHEAKEEFRHDLEIMQSYHSQLRTNMITENAYFDFYYLVNKYSDPEIIESLNISENDLNTLERYKTDIQNYDIIKGTSNDFEENVKVH